MCESDYITGLHFLKQKQKSSDIEEKTCENIVGKRLLKNPAKVVTSIFFFFRYAKQILIDLDMLLTFSCKE